MSGCHIGCFYYTDSCFRKDCKMIRTPAHKQTDPDKLPGQTTAKEYKPTHGGYPDAHPFADYQRRAIEQLGQGPSIEVGDTE